MSWQNRRSLGDYAKKRFLRIYPGLFVTSLVCMFIVGPLGADDAHTYWHDLRAGHLSGALHFFLDLLLLQAAMPPIFTHLPVAGSVNAPLWTIMLEIRCYVLVAVLGTAAALIGRRLPRPLLLSLPLLLFVTIYVVYVLCCTGYLATVVGWVPVNPASHAGHVLAKIGTLQGVVPRMLLYFLSGMCLYLYRAFIPYKWPLALTALAILFASIYGVPLIAYTLPLAGAYLLLFIAFVPSPLATFGTKTDLSYGLYLYAFPVQQLLILHYGPQFYGLRYPVTALFCTALLIASGLALLSWHFVEKPSLRLKKVSLPDRLRFAGGRLPVRAMPARKDVLPEKEVLPD